MTIISDKVIFLVCVEDTFFFGTEEKYINGAIKNISDYELELEVEESIAGFLGTHMDHNHQNGSINLTQN